MEWNTPWVIIGVLLFVVGYTLGRVSKTLESVREARARWVPDPAIDEASIEAAVRARQKVEAIRLYRRRNGASEKAARQAIEALAQRINVRF